MKIYTHDNADRETDRRTRIQIAFECESPATSGPGSDSLILQEWILPSSRKSNTRSQSLGRFLPPLEQGSVASALQGFGDKADRLLDPFGASPRLAVEAAAEERAVLVAVNNPIGALRARADSGAIHSTRSSIGPGAGSAQPLKIEVRLEPFMLDLYLTQCSNCEEWISADYFCVG